MASFSDTVTESANSTTTGGRRRSNATRRTVTTGRRTSTAGTARPELKARPERAPVVLPARRSGHSGLAVKLLLVGAMAVAALAIVQEGRADDRGPAAEPPELIVHAD